jgi:hypothetical protein
MVEREGVIKFDLQYKQTPALTYSALRELNAWRTLLHRARLIGLDPSRYGGVGYGNISQRHKKTFVVSGTQTQTRPLLTAQHYSIVMECDPDINRIKARGPVAPSSEALTHGTVYDRDTRARFVMHVHSPIIWRKAKSLGIPLTDKRAAFGTPEMAAEVERLFKKGVLRKRPIFAMGGHEDGVVTFGRTGAEAGFLLLRTLVQAVRS